MSNRTLDRVGRRLPPDRYHRLRYEDLLAEPRQTLEQVCAFLDEDFAPQMLDHSGAAHDIVPTRKNWHNRVQGPLDATRTEVWRRDLTPTDIGLVELFGRREMARHGYRRSDAGQRPPAKEIAATLRQISGTRRALARQWFDDARLRRRFPMPLASQL
jgi:hypothetical protein